MTKQDFTQMFMITKTATGATFMVKVQPGANKNKIVGVQQDTLRIRISAPAVQGKANKMLIQFLAKQLAVKRRQVKILSGHTTTSKTIHIVGEGNQKKLQNIIDSTSV